MASLRRSQVPSLDEQLRRWVDAGIITGEQADAIARLEAGQPAEPLPGGPGRRLPLVAEALAYLGIVLVTVSGTFVVVRLWGDLRVGGQVAAGVVVAILGLGAGATVGSGADPGARRLGSFLSLCGTGGVGIVAGVAAAALGGGTGTITLTVGLAVLAVSVALWRNRERPLSFLSSLGGAVAAGAGLQEVAHLGLTPAQFGWVVWGAGVGLAALGWWRVVHPSSIALVVGVLASLGAALAIADSHQGVGVAVGLVTAVAAVAAGVLGRQVALAGVGVAGFLVLLARTLAIYVQGTASAIAVLVLGVALVAVAVWRWRRHGNDHAPPPTSGRTTPPVAGLTPPATQRRGLSPPRRPPPAASRR